MAVTREHGSIAVSIHDELAGIVHDLKSPLTTVGLQAELLRGRGDVTARRALDAIRDNVVFMDRLLRNLLDLSRREGHLELKVRTVPLSLVIEAVVERMDAVGERPRLFVEIRDEVTADVNVDRIERVVQNLLENALKYSPPDSEVIVRLEAKGEQALVSVIDTGSGLSERDARHVFDRYRRGDNAGSIEGTGLGLYTCRSIVEQHGGRIGVESVTGVGSRFYFELPASARFSLR